MRVPDNPVKDGQPLTLRVGGLTLYSGDEIPAEFNSLVPDEWKKGTPAPAKVTADAAPKVDA